MKNLKKLGSIALALVMVMAMMIPAFADNTYSITINNDKAGHTYEAYQVFSGTLSEDGATLSDVKWGAGVTFAADEKVVYPAGGEAKSAAEIAKALVTTEDAKAFATFVAGHLATTATGSANELTNDKYVISRLPVGYYLVKDADSSLQDDDDTYTGYILEVVDNVTVTPKTTGKPVLDKTSGTAHKVDASVGDVIPFTLQATLPNTVSEYVKGYKLVFTDTLTGLDLDKDSIKISVNGTQVTGDISSYIAVAGNVLTITINDVTASPFNASNNSVITVDYNATLNSTAIATDNAGNKVGLEYSNDPNGDGTGKTDTDVVVDVYSYEVEINKFDGADNEALAGVKFKLYKGTGADKKYAVVANGVITGWDATGTELTTDADGKIAIDGLGSGTYYLEETQPLDGYNKIEDVEVVITGTPANDTLTATVGGENAATANQTVTAMIANNTGAVLPSTGGMGTTIFYAIGGVLLAGSAVLFVTKKRMGE